MSSIRATPWTPWLRPRYGAFRGFLLSGVLLCHWLAALRSAFSYPLGCCCLRVAYLRRLDRVVCRSLFRSLVGQSVRVQGTPTAVAPQP